MRGTARAAAIGLSTLLVLALAGGAAEARCATPQDMAAVSGALLERLNAERARGGRSPLVASAALAQAAQDHACAMSERGFFGHRGADGSSLRDRMIRRAYRPCFGAENIARGQRGVGEVMGAWMGSRGHRSNILESRAREVGLGVGAGPDGRLNWVLKLGRRC